MSAFGKTISLIIPAHNEADNITRVLNIVTKIEELDEILVVADACQDNTAEIAKSYGVKVLYRDQSLGKGDAMIDGFNHVSGEIIMFCDADLKTLTTEHIRQVFTPVASGQAELSIGLRDRIFGLAAILPKILPMYAIGGERAMTRKFFELIPKDKNTLDFGIETVMNFYAKRHNIKIALPILKNLHQVIKEQKWGFWSGLIARIHLYWQIMRTRFIMRHRKDL